MQETTKQHLYEKSVISNFTIIPRLYLWIFKVVMWPSLNRRLWTVKALLCRSKGNILRVIGPFAWSMVQCYEVKKGEVVQECGRCGMKTVILFMSFRNLRFRSTGDLLPI